MFNPQKERSLAVPVFFLAVLSAVLMVRSFYSFCQTDESFYAAMVNRLWTGERMLVDEWNSTQFYVPLLLPFYGLFVLLNGSTDFVLLFLRLLYLVFAVIVAVKLFMSVWGETGNRFISTTAASVVLLFSRGNIYGVSYYNLCMLCIISGFCTFAGGQRKDGKRRVGSLFRSGILFAAGILCNPFLAIFAILILLYGLVRQKSRKDTVAVITGIAFLAAFYLLVLMIGTGFQGILDNIGYVLNSPEQSSISDNLISSVRQIVSISRYALVPAVLMTIACITPIPEKKKQLLVFPYLLLQSVLLAWTAVRTINGICCVVVIPMTVIAFPFLFVERKGRKKTAPLLYLLGIVTAAAYTMASNTGADAGTVGFCISAAAGLWICAEVFPLAEENVRKQMAALILVASFLLLPMACQRIVGVYRDAPIQELKVRLTQGPAKGLYTTSEHAAQYDSICETVKDFSVRYPEGKILFTKNLPWAYLITDYGYGTSSPWRTYTEDLNLYYSITPEHRPDYICILAENVGSWKESPLNRNPGNDRPNKMEYTGKFWETVRNAPCLKECELLEIYDTRDIWS